MKLFRNNILLGLMALMVVACSEDTEPEMETLQYFQMGKPVNHQRTVAGNSFADTTWIHILSYREDQKVSDFSVSFEVINGNGTVSPSIANPDENGDVRPRWTSGNEHSIQKLLAAIYDDKGKFLDTLVLSGYALKKGRWDTVGQGSDNRMQDLAFNNQTSLMTVSNMLFIQGVLYFDWKEVSNTFDMATPRRVEVNSRGEFFVSNNNGELYKSIDDGQNWNYLGKPVPEYRAALNMRTTPDDYLWVAAEEYGLYCSRDDGETWEKSYQGLGDEPLALSEMQRLSNGKFILRTKNRGAFISHDDGFSWEPFSIPEITINLFVTPQDDIITIAIDQTGKYKIYKSTDMGETFNEKMDIPFLRSWWVADIRYYQGLYYLGLSGKGVYTTPDFENFEVFYENADIKRLFMADNGVLIGTHTKHKATYYYKVSAP